VTDKAGIPADLRLSTEKHKHGRHRTPEWTAWREMRARCLNPRHRAYSNYGGRGIGICERWRGSFAAFLEDLGERPSPMHSLDRIDNDRGYEPGNCRWATKTVQSRNSRNARLVTFQGRTMCLAEAVELSGLRTTTVAQRLHKGWSVERALNTPLDVKRSSARKGSKSD
jgi:hypothetical protein